MLRRLKRQDPLIGNIQDNKTNMSTAALGVAKYRYEGQLKEANEQGRVRYTTRLIWTIPETFNEREIGG